MQARKLFHSAVILFIPGLALAVASFLTPGTWASSPQQTEISYTVTHPFHEATGVSTKGEVRGLVTPEEVKVEARVPADSFDSGNANRDSNALSVIEAAKYPYVVFKGTGTPCEATGGTCDLVLDGSLTFHGVKKSYRVPVTLKADKTGRLACDFKFTVSLSAHKVEVPSLMFIPLDDKMEVEGHVAMEVQP